MDYVREAAKVFDHPRPEQFLDNPNHCWACQEVEQNAQRNDLDSLTVDAAGIGFAPMLSFMKASAVLYYMPAFIRLVVEEAGNDDFVWSFLFRITEYSDLAELCSEEQKSFMASFLRWYKENYLTKFRDAMVDEEAIDDAIDVWSV
jgi:hypothetical protein